MTNDHPAPHPKLHLIDGRYLGRRWRGILPRETCTPAALRKLLRRYDPLDHRRAPRVLSVSIESADAILREACQAGYLNYKADHPVPAWSRTSIGQSLIVNPRVKRIPRKKALAQLARVLRHAKAINAASGLHRVREIRLFGSLAHPENEEVGDLDLEVELERRDEAEIEASGALERAAAALPDPGYSFERFAPEKMRAFGRDARRVRTELAQGSRSIVITDDQIAGLAAIYRVAFRAEGGVTLVRSHSWWLADLIKPGDPRHVGHGDPDAAKRVAEPGLGWPLRPTAPACRKRRCAGRKPSHCQRSSSWAHTPSTRSPKSTTIG